MIDPLAPTPLYVQLADLLAGMIERDELREGSPLPSESYLQQEHGLARGTVRSAVRLPMHGQKDPGIDTGPRHDHGRDSDSAPRRHSGQRLHFFAVAEL